MNPFNPGFGKIPPIYLKRTEDIQTVTDNLGNPNSPYQTTLIYGMRGTGKTAFLTDISHETEKRDHWIVVNLVPGNPLLPTLIDSIYRKAATPLQKAFQMIQGISVSAFGITINTAPGVKASDQQYQNLLEIMLQKLKESKTWLLITLDEAKSTPELRQFASVYQLMLRENYLVTLLMSGLPQYVSQLQNDDVLTFLLRAGRITLAPLDLWAVRENYAKAFAGNRTISDELLIKITRLTGGYAYAFQLLGYYLWENSENAITEKTIDKTLPMYKTDLYRNAYAKMYQSLSRMEQEFIKTMAGIGESASIHDIQDKMHKEKNYISMYRKRLIDTQLIISPQRGILKFSLPFFRDFVIENQLLFEE